MRRRNQRGTTAVEYALLLAGIAAAIFLVLPALGHTLKGEFEDADTSLVK